MQQTDRIDVLTTHLAETDRRGLSQAWYSALHVAERAPRVPHAAVARGAASRFSPPASRPASRNTSLHAQYHANPVRASAREAAHRRVVAVPEPERRFPKTALARQLECTLIRRVPRAAATSFALRAGDARVHLLVRSDGARTRVIAVCAPSLRERVERALAQARFVLAGRISAEVA